MEKQKKNNKIINKRNVAYTLTVILSIVAIFIGNSMITSRIQPFEGQDTTQYSKAKVVEAEEPINTTYEDSVSGLETYLVTFRAELLEGPQAGETVEAVQNIDPSMQGELKPVEVGDKVILNEYIDTYGDTGTTWQLVNYVRLNFMILLAVIFLILLIIFGRIKGINTIVSLGFTFAMIFLVFIPSILAGFNIYISVTLLCTYVIAMNMLILNGPNKKSLVSAIGCFGGVITAGLLSVGMQQVLHLTGYIDDAMVNLSFIGGGFIDLNAIIFAAILIGSLGAVMDVAISIASSIHEISQADKESTVTSLTKAGFNIGRDMMGTMSNTLILAYIGSSLATMLTLTVYDISTNRMLNREFIIVEMLQTLVGSIGLLITIPLTTIVGAMIYKPKTNKSNYLDNIDEIARQENEKGNSLFAKK